MAKTTIQKNRAQVYAALIGLLGVVVGTFGKMWIDSNQPKDYSIGKVQEYKGIFIFIRSRPVQNTYTSLGIISSDVIERAVESSSEKKGLGKIFESFGKSVLSDMTFENRLTKIVEAAHRYSPTIEGVIFNDDLTQCEVITFIKS